jgi:Leucine-rich repeat (LRR) protein
MKHHAIALLALCFLVSACAGKKDDNAVSGEGTEDAANTVQTITIGGYTREWSDYFVVTIGGNYSADLSGIEQLAEWGLLRLTLLKDANDIDFSPLHHMHNLRTVNLGGRGVTKIPDFSASPSLTRLEIAGSSLSSLDGIEKIPSLEILQIRDNRVPLTDISALRHLRNIKSLRLSGGFHINFSALENLANLEDLTTWQIGNLDLTGIRQLTQLKRLSLHIYDDDEYFEISEPVMFINLEEVGSLTGLEHLHIEYPLQSVTFLSNLTSLTSLGIIGEYYSDGTLPSLDVGPLANLVNLKSLTIHNFEIVNREALNALPNLEYFADRFIGFR